METASLLPVRVTSYRLIGFIFTIAALLSTLGTLYVERERARALTALPHEERQVLYERTLAAFRSTCTTTRGVDLEGYCHEQAHLLSRMRECDAACQMECQKHMPRATR